MDTSITHHLSTVRRTHANDLVGGPRAVASQKSQWPPRTLEAGSEWSGLSYATRCGCQYEVVRLVANGMAASTIIRKRYTTSEEYWTCIRIKSTFAPTSSSASRHRQALSQPVVEEDEALSRKRLAQRLV